MKDSGDTIKGLNEWFKIFNHSLFGDELNLNNVKILIHRKKGASGYFWSNILSDESKNYHEISLNPDLFNRSEEEVLSTLVHEMCHMWQYDCKTPPKNGYHDKTWAKKMKEVGLDPICTNGKSTGKNCSHTINNSGDFIKVYLKNKDKYKIDFKSLDLTEVKEQKPKGSGGKNKYSCECSNIWGKPGLNITCNECGEIFIMQ